MFPAFAGTGKSRDESEYVICLCIEDVGLPYFPKITFLIAPILYSIMSI